MTMDKSLRTRKGMARSRSVLKRSERITRLREADLWQETSNPLGLPKVRVYKLTMKKKKKKKEEEGAEATTTTAAAPAAKPAASKAGGKAGGKK